MTCAAGGAGELRRSRIRHARRQVQDRLPLEVELGRQADLGGAADAEPVADVAERAVDGERRRRQHRRAHPIEQQLADDRRHVDGRRAQEHAAPAELDEVDVTRIAARAAGTAARSRSLAGAARPARRDPFGRRPRAPSSIVVRLSSAPDAARASLRPGRARRSRCAAASLACDSDVGGRADPLLAARPVVVPVRVRELGEERRASVAQPVDGLVDLVASRQSIERARRGQPLDVARQLLDAVGADAERRSTASRRPRAGAPRRRSRGCTPGSPRRSACCLTAASAHSR